MKSWTWVVLTLAFLLPAAISAAQEKKTKLPVDYYVSDKGKDTNDGSAQRPWASITMAASRLRPGVTVHVAAGTYAGPVVTRASGTAQARIRFVSDRKWTAKIVTTSGEIVWSNFGDYVDIAGFDISGNSDVGIDNEGSSVRIIGNHIHDIKVPVDGCEKGGAGISHSGYSSTNNETLGNVVDHIGITNPKSCAHGIYHSTNGGRVQNNVIHNVHGCGISTWHAATHVLISNNLIFRAQGPDSCGILIGAGDAPHGVTHDYSVVTNNIVIDNNDPAGGYGILEFGSTGPHNLYSNNLLYNNRVATRLQQGVTPRSTIEADPKLVQYARDGSGDYRLCADSPAVDAGTPFGAPDNDFAGERRSGQKGIDIGPYRFVAGATPCTSSGLQAAAHR